MSFTATVTGIKELNQAFQKLDDDLKRRALEAALEAGAHPLYSAMIEAAPSSVSGVRGEKLASRNHPAGNLKKAIRLLKSKEGQFPTVWVKPVKGQGDPDGWYAKFVEFGHLSRPGKFSKGRIKKHEAVRFIKGKGFGFIRKTFDSGHTNAEQIIQKKIFETVNEYLK